MDITWKIYTSITFSNVWTLWQTSVKYGTGHTTQCHETCGISQVYNEVTNVSEVHPDTNEVYFYTHFCMNFKQYKVLATLLTQKKQEVVL